MLGGWSQAALAARLCRLLDFRPFHLLHSAVFGIAENCVMRWRNAHLAWMRAGCAATDQPQPNSAFAALNQAPKARLAAFGIENRLASPKPDRLQGYPVLSSSLSKGGQVFIRSRRSRCAGSRSPGSLRITARAESLACSSTSRSRTGSAMEKRRNPD